jgi:hypothetical protein
MAAIRYKRMGTELTGMMVTEMVGIAKLAMKSRSGSHPDICG